MAKRARHSILSRVIAFKPGEAAIACYFFFSFFLITAPYYIIKPIRNSSYLEQLGDERLPLAYFLTALLMGFIVNFHSQLQARLTRRALVILSFLFFISNLGLFWWLFQKKWAWVPVVFWLWANIFAVVLVTQFWLLVNDVFNPREAKRLIGFIGSGGQLGAILGSLLVGVLARTKAFSLLLPLAALFLSLGILAVLRIFQIQKEGLAPDGEKPQKLEIGRDKEAKVGFRDALETTTRHRYLRLLAGIMATTIIVSTLIDWQFNSVVHNAVQGGSKLASFFGYFNAGTMAFAFLFQLFFTSPLLRRVGIRLALLIYPLVLLFGSAGIGVIAYASIVPAILIKANDKSLAYSLNQSVRELLYIPISPEEKYKSKIFIDMFVNRLAKGLGAVFLMLVLIFFPKPSVIPAISLVAMAILLVWLYLNFRAGGEYANLVKAKLRIKWRRGEKVVAEKIDVDFTKLVFDTLQSRDRSSVLYALHLYDLIRQDKLTPEVRRLLGYQEDEIRAASLGTLFEQTETELGPIIQEDWTGEGLAKEVAEIMALDVYQEVVKNYLERTIADKTEASTVARMEAAKAIGLMPPRSPAAERLAELLEDNSVEVVRYALQSAGALKRKEDVPAVIRKLKNPVLREDASSALSMFGPKIIGTLSDYLADADEDTEVRLCIPAILAMIGTQDAVNFLCWELAEAEGRLANAIIESLDQLRELDSGLRFPEPLIRLRLQKEIFSFCADWLSAWEGEAQPAGEALGSEFKKREAEYFWNIFRLLGLIYSHEDMMRAYQNLKTGSRESVAYALELLDNVLEMGTRNILFPLIEDLPAEERIRRCRALMENLPGTKEKREEKS